MPLSKLKIAAIVVNAIVFLFTLGMNYLSRGGNAVFPESTGNVSDNRSTLITPSGGTFTIWAFIYTFQFAMVAYTMSLLFRKRAANILPVGYYVAYTLVCVFNFSWLLAWSRYNTIASFVLLVLIALSLKVALFFSYRSLQRYLDGTRSGYGEEDGDMLVLGHEHSVVDVWCVRLLCQNGLIFYNAWLCVASCINMVIVIQYNLGKDGSKAATGGLSVLLILILAWFVLENFVLAKYTRFTCIEYIVIIVATGGILKKHNFWPDGHPDWFVVSLLVISAVLLLVRVGLIIRQELRLKQREELGVGT